MKLFVKSDSEHKALLQYGILILDIDKKIPGWNISYTGSRSRAGDVMQVLEYKAKNKRTKETLLTCLADLFYRYRYRGRGEGGGVFFPHLPRPCLQ